MDDDKKTVRILIQKKGYTVTVLEWESSPLHSRTFESAIRALYAVRTYAAAAKSHFKIEDRQETRDAFKMLCDRAHEEINAVIHDIES